MPPETTGSAGQDRITSSATPDGFAWDEEVQVLVTLRVRATPNLDYYEGLEGRTPLDAAMAGAWRAGCTLDRVDGFADMHGEVDVIDVQEGY